MFWKTVYPLPLLHWCLLFNQSSTKSCNLWDALTRLWGGRADESWSWKKKSDPKLQNLWFQPKPFDGPEGPRKIESQGMPFKKGVFLVFLPKTERHSCFPGCHTGYSHSLPPPSIPMPWESLKIISASVFFRIRQSANHITPPAWISVGQTPHKVCCVPRSLVGDVTGETPEITYPKISYDVHYILYIYIDIWRIHYIEWKYVPNHLWSLMFEILPCCTFY